MTQPRSRRASLALVAGSVTATLGVSLGVVYGIGSAAVDQPATRLVLPASGGATDVGVTDDSIRVAIFVADVGGFADADNTVEVANQAAAWTVFYDDLNARGGIHGRTVDYRVVPFDILSAESMRTACIRATEDLEAFAVTTIASPYGPGLRCIVDEHETPMLVEGQVPESAFAAAGGRLWSLGMSGDRGVRNQVADLAAAGLLDDAVVGVMEWEETQASPRSVYLEELEALGYRECDEDAVAPCYLYQTLGSGSSDLAALSAQANVAVEEMQAAGVDRVFLRHAIFGVAIVCAAMDGHDWRPQLLLPQLAVGVLEDNPQACAAPVADGAIGTTSTWHGERAARAPVRDGAAACVQRYETLTGETLDPYETGTGPFFGLAVSTCVLFDAFVAAATAAGPDLTRAGLIDALGETGALPDGIAFSGSWTPAKHDGADFIRTVEFDATGCACWTLVDDEPRPAHF